MKIDLLKFVEGNKKTKDLQDEVDFKKELNKLIANIITGEKEFFTNSDMLIEKLNIKCKKNIFDVSRSFFEFYPLKKYTFKLNKTNIKKIQSYIDKEEK